MADIDKPVTNGHTLSDDEEETFGSDDGIDSDIEPVENVSLDKPKPALKKTSQPVPLVSAPRPLLPEQPDPKDLKVEELTPLSPEIISRQATINIGTIGRENIQGNLSRQIALMWVRCGTREKYGSQGYIWSSGKKI